MKTSVITPANYRRMPWRNGLGTTVELIRRDLDHGNGFAWRLSMAEVTEDGEFSNFTGYQRCLLLLDGNGITLDCAGQLHRLEQPLQAAHFDGGDATFARLHDGPITDFNIMALRGHCRAAVTSQVNRDAAHIDIDTDLLLLYAVGAGLDWSLGDDAAARLAAEHLLVVENPPRQQLHCANAGFIATQISYL